MVTRKIALPRYIFDLDTSIHGSFTSKQSYKLRHNDQFFAFLVCRHHRASKQQNRFHGSPDSEPHLDLGLALNHPSASDKKRKHPAATPNNGGRVPPAPGVLLQSDHSSPPPETVHEGIAKKQDRPPRKRLLKTIRPPRAQEYNRSEFPKSQEKSQAIENSRKRKNTENRALEKEENHENQGKRVSEARKGEVLVTWAEENSTAYVAEPSDLELKGEMNLKFTTELASKMNEINQQDRDSLSNVISSSEVHEILIEACGYTTEEPEYLEEQIHLQDEMFKIFEPPRDQAEYLEAQSQGIHQAPKVQSLLTSSSAWYDK
ncbi:hypothetical protein H4Q26_007831 [Puccinia striiformis f. sp. tritici PST-130]|nr:hypothetical protein H4Q26_007831 [Puccinia striiformis f. sp. tritici PST-130]